MDPELFAFADSGSEIIIPDPDLGRLLLEQTHHVVTPIQEVEYATLDLESVLWIRIRICPYGSGYGIIIPDPDLGRLLLEQAHHVITTPIQEVENATLEFEAALWIRIRNFWPLRIWIWNNHSGSGSEIKWCPLGH